MLDFEVSFGRRNFQFGQGECVATVRNNKNRSVFPHAPTASGQAKSEEDVANAGNREIGVFIRSG